MFTNKANFSNEKEQALNCNLGESSLSVIKILARSFAHNFCLPVAHIKRLIKFGRGEALADEANIDLDIWDEPREMPNLSRWGLKHFNISFMRARRRQNFDLLFELLKDTKEVHCLFPYLPKGNVPYSFPILVKDRTKLIKFAADFGLYLEPSLTKPYRDLPNLVNKHEQFALLEKTVSQIVSVPIHQALSDKNIRFIARVIKLGLKKGCG